MKNDVFVRECQHYDFYNVKIMTLLAVMRKQKGEEVIGKLEALVSLSFKMAVKKYPYLMKHKVEV